MERSVIAFLLLFFVLFSCCEAFLSHAVRDGRVVSKYSSRIRNDIKRIAGTSSSTKLNFKTFDEMLTTLECPVLVDFYAQWCGPCRMMQPVLEEIAGRMETEIKVAKVDTDKSPRLGNRYQVEALPTLILFSKGEMVERYVGYMSADELEAAVKKTLVRINAGKQQ